MHAPPPTRAPVVSPFDGGWQAHGFFLALTLFFCLSLVIHPTDVPMGPPLGDTMTTQWNFWWVDQVMRGATTPTEGLLHTNRLFHPLGADLSYHTMEFPYAILLWPLRLIGGGFLQHNASLIIATYLMAWACWLAARQWGAGRFGAAACTAALTIHGYRLAEGIHLNIFSTYLFPLTIYLLKRITDECAAGEAIRWKSAAALGITGILTLLTSLFHALECLIYLLIFVAPLLFTRRAILPAIMKQFALAGLIAAPIAVWLAWHLATAPKPPSFGPDAQVGHAADLWQFVIHPRIRMLLAGVENDWLSVFMDGRQRAWVWYLPGYTLIVGGAIAALRLKQSSQPRMLLFAGIFFWILALGPALKLGSPMVLNGEPTPIPLPGRLLSWVPFLGTLRSIWHFGFTGTVCIAIYTCVWLEHGLAMIHEERRRLLQALALVIIAAESFIGGLGSFANRMDGAAKFLTQQKQEGAVAFFPQYFYQYRGYFMYHQTIHGRPIVGGYIARDPIAFEDWKKERLWPIELEETGYGRIPGLDDAGLSRMKSDMEKHNIRFVEIHDDTREKWFSGRIAAELAKTGMRVVYTDEETMVLAGGR